MTATSKVSAISAYATVIFALVASSNFASAGNPVFVAAPPTAPVQTLGAAPTGTVHRPGVPDRGLDCGMFAAPAIRFSRSC